MSAVQVVAGFSLTNRWLLYTSVLLAPAQFLCGIGSISPVNVGFLVYNWYTQLQWYWAIKDQQLHALSLLPVHFNLIYAVTYLAGVSSGNLFLGLPLGLGTAGVLILNSVSAWTAWAVDQPQGFDDYQFFFFGWRTLTPGWHTFFLLWQIGDSLFALSCVFGAVILSIQVAVGDSKKAFRRAPWLLLQGYKYLAIPVGAVISLVAFWPLILWTELIVARNNIESDTDPIAVWLFIAQVITMVLPDPCDLRECWRDNSGDSAYSV